MEGGERDIILTVQVLAVDVRTPLHYPVVVGGGQAVSQGTIWLQHKRVFSGDQNAFLKNHRKIPLVQ